jgi:hypothetical protein
MCRGLYVVACGCEEDEWDGAENEVLSLPLEKSWKGGEWMKKRVGVLFRSSTCKSRQESLGEGCTEEDPVYK